MKRFFAFVLCIVALIATARVLAPDVHPEPENPSVTQKVLRVLAGWWISRKIFREDPPPPAEPEIQEPLQLAEPPLVGDESPMRSASTESVPELDHGAGW